MPFDEGMRIQKFANSFAKRARAVAVNDAHARLVFQGRIIQEFVQAIRGLFDGHPNHVDLVCGDGCARLRMHRNA